MVRKRADEALGESEDKFRQLFTQMPSAVAIYDAVDGGEDFIFKDFNTAAEKIEGIKKVDLIGKRVTQVFPGVKDFGIFAVFQRVWRTGQPEFFPSAIYRDEREPGTWRENWVYKLASGEVVAIYNDITERKRAELELVSAQERLKEAHRLAHIGTWDWVMENDTVTWSEELYNIAGRDPSLPAPTYAEHPRVYTPASWDSLSCAVTRALTTGEPYNLELELVRPDGSLRWINAFGGVKRDRNGKVIGLHGTLQDITERKHVEEKLRESESRFFTVFQASPIAISITNFSDGKTSDVNPTFLRLFGYTREEVIGHTTLELNVWADPEERDQMFKLLREQGGVRNYETQFRKKSGEVGTLLVSADVIDLAGDQYLLSLLQDITERKRAADALKESRIQLAEAMDLAHLVNWEFDVPTGIFTFDDRFYALYGTTAEREGGNQMPAEVYTREFVHPDDHDVVANEVNKAINSSDPRYVSQVEHRIIRRDGEIRHIVVRIGITKDANGRTIKTHGANQDITERKMMEDEIRSLNKALEQRVEQRTAQLTSSLKDKEVLLREVHHRVKNNLQIIISLLNLQSRYITDENVLAAIRESQNRVKAMALVHEKLYQSADIAKINLDDYVRFMGNSLFQFYGMKGKGITFTTTIPEVTLDINTAIPIGLITNELISNSLKHAFPDGRKGEISIAIHRQDHTLTILFKDNGVGIPQDFDWRNAKSLGLRLVISLVEQLQGTIELDRSSGTAFTIVLKEKA